MSFALAAAGGRQRRLRRVEDHHQSRFRARVDDDVAVLALKIGTAFILMPQVAQRR